MAAYATPAQLNLRLRRTVPADQATQALEDASAAVDEFLGYPLTEQAGYVWEATVVGTTDAVYLPKRIRSVSAVSLAGVARAAGTWTFKPETGKLTLAGGRKFYAHDALSVTGTSGYAAGAIPFVVRGVTLSVAGRTLDNPSGGLRSESLGDHAMVYSGDDPTGGAYLTDTEEQQLAGFRDWPF